MLSTNNKSFIEPYFHDLMSPKERANALSLGLSVDRMPIYMSVDNALPALLGTTKRECDSNAKKQAALQIAGYKMFGHDNVGLFLGYSMAITLGATYIIPEHVDRIIKEKPMKSIDDFGVLDLDKINFKNDKIAAQVFDAIRYVQDEIGDEIDCSIAIRAPLSAASGLIELDTLLRAMILETEKVEELLMFAELAQFKLAEKFLKEGINVSISDPIASCALISPQLYRDLALPFEKKFINRCMKYMDTPPGLHICGNTTSILLSVAESGASSYSLDNRVDLDTAKSLIGDKLALSGNIDPVSKMLNGTEADIRESVRDCFKKAWDSPKGFAINTGCDLCFGTPLKNLIAYMDESRLCAKEHAEAMLNPKENYIWDE